MNHNPIIHPNMNIGNEIKPGPTTEIGKFRSSLNAVRGNKSNKFNNIKPELRELYMWFKGKNTDEINSLLQLKKISMLFDEISFPALIDRIQKGEAPTKREMEILRLAKETHVDIHKLEFGDKHVVEHKVTYKDVMKQLNSDTEIIEADFMEVKDEIRQNPDSGGSGADGLRQDGINTGTDKSPEEIQKSD